MTSLVLINLAISCYLLGLIFTIQVVHYPSFIYADRNLFHKFHLFHVKRISLIVMIPMLAELLAAGALAFISPSTMTLFLLSLVLLIWLSTAFLSVPRHNKLATSKNPRLISELTLTNWPRTILWSARVGILFYLSLSALT